MIRLKLWWWSVRARYGVRVARWWVRWMVVRAFDGAGGTSRYAFEPEAMQSMRLAERRRLTVWLRGQRELLTPSGREFAAWQQSLDRRPARPTREQDDGSPYAWLGDDGPAPGRRRHEEGYGSWGRPYEPSEREGRGTQYGEPYPDPFEHER